MAKSKGRLLSELVESPKNEDYADVNALPNTGNKVGDQAFVEATDRLYIWNGSGWYNIALVNTTPTWDSYGQPSGSYVLDPDSPSVKIHPSLQSHQKLHLRLQRAVLVLLPLGQQMVLISYRKYQVLLLILQLL